MLRGEKVYLKHFCNHSEIGEACAAPTGLSGLGGYVPTASAVGYVLSSLAGLFCVAARVGNRKRPAWRPRGGAARYAWDCAVMRETTRLRLENVRLAVRLAPAAMQPSPSRECAVMR